jgi:probable HAF family extracellular repeat protein
MGRLPPSVATASLALFILTSACGQSPVQPLPQSPANPAPPDTVTPFATVSRTDLGTLGGAASYATDINDWGVVVGWSKTVTGVDRAFHWTAAQGMTDLGTLPGDQWSRAVSITNAGEILGISGAGGTMGYGGTPVVWDPSGSVTPLPIPLLPGATSMGLADRNVLGQVVGSGYGGSIPSGHAWIWSESVGIHDVTPDIPGAYEAYGSGSNESGVMVGTYRAAVCVRAPECWHAFVWSPLGGYRDLGVPENDLPNREVTASALNNLGVVVGWTSLTRNAGPVQPYKWTESTGFTVLPTFSSSYGYATSVNVMGTIIGASTDAQFGAIQAAAWPVAGGIVKLSPDDPNPSVAVAINASGVVAGWSSLGTANHATVWMLGPGRGLSARATGSRLRSPMLTAAKSGPVACLSDARAVISKQLLIDCVVKSQ